MFLSKKKKHVYIHIGCMKTGTSAIQSFLSSNDSFLHKNDFYFPTINKKAMNFLGFSLLDEIPPYIHHKLSLTRNELFKKLQDEIRNSKQNKIILSAEAFSLITNDIFLGEEAPRRLFTFLENISISFTIIVFIRRQDDYLESQYNQHVKTHNFWNLFSSDILSFYEEKIELFDFNSLIEKWARIFGDENVNVKVYDKGQNSVQEFLSLLGITKYDNNLAYSKVNYSLNKKALEFMRIANKYGIDKSSVNKNTDLINLINKALGENDRVSSLMSSSDSKKILKKHLDGNIKLSAKFLNNDISWFQPKINYPIQNNFDDNLSIDESIKIATLIWNYYNNDK